MSTQQKTKWITGREYNDERLRLIRAGIPDDAPEFRALNARMHERDNYLFETYGKQHYDSNYGKWIAISIDGRVLIRDTASELGWDASDVFGGGNFAVRKLNEVGGHRLLY
jgi:hypothetical protein